MQPTTYYQRHKAVTKMVLHLTLKRKWFDLICSGEKTVEYRDCKPYWIKRLFHEFPLKPKAFLAIYFRNGYSKRSPLISVGHLGTYYNHALNKIELMLGENNFLCNPRPTTNATKP